MLHIEPPTATAQMKKVRIVKGRPMFYEPEKVKNAKATLKAGLCTKRVLKPYDGALELKVCWMFGTKDKKKIGTWRVTRPDTDNLQKMLKDCMTDLEFWHDDSQVVRENVEKKWVPVSEQGILIEIKELGVCTQEQ